MVKALRKKFVIITVVMMLILFGVLWTVNNKYTEYWMDQDILSILKTVSCSGLFEVDSKSGEFLQLGGETDGEPIIGFVIRDDGAILSRTYVGNSPANAAVSEDIISRMYEAEPGSYHMDEYIFIKKRIDDNKTLIVAIDSSPDEDENGKILGNILWGIVGVMFLIVITFYLSKFVVFPAKEALRREKRFISDASHELKTPLGAIRINAQALELRNQDSLYIKNIISEADRMNRLVERLLTLSRLDEADLGGKSVFPLSQVLQEMLLTYESIAFEKGILLDYEIDEDLSLLGDADEIRQLVAIMLDNAIKNTQNRRNIHFVCRKEQARIKLTITNYGFGIRDEDIEHIFERFYTTDESRTRGSFGLGLAIAKSIVERHDGEISVESNPVEEPDVYETVFKIIL